MSENQPVAKRVDLRKYPNRRYYDSARSQHVTLEEIYEMVRCGSEVQVTDSKTGEDITAKVLAQIILEHDAPKMGIFPVELLHQLIRANEPLIRDFVDKYFHQAFTIFLESQRQFDHYLRHAFGLQPPLSAGQEWARMMMGPMGQLLLGGPEEGKKAERDWSSAGAASVETPPTEAAAGSTDSPARQEKEELQRLVADLRRQVSELHRELDTRTPRPSGRDKGAKDRAAKEQKDKAVRAPRRKREENK